MYIYICMYIHLIMCVYIYNHIYLAHQEPINLKVFSKKRFFLQLWKKRVFLRKYGFFFTREKNNFFSHLVSWHLMIPSPRRFKPLYWYQPWIYPSQYPSCWLYFHPAGFGWQFSQERARCSWNMSDNIKCDHSQSGVVGWIFPKNHPYKHKLKHGCIFFIGKNDSGLPKSYKQPKKSIEKINKIMKNQSALSVFNHFGWQF